MHISSLVVTFVMLSAAKLKHKTFKKMSNVLSLSIEEQNNFNSSVFTQIFSDNKSYAEESDENVADYFIRDFEESPEGWNPCFEYSYDEVSTKAKQERKSILINMLVSEGYIPTQED